MKDEPPRSCADCPDLAHIIGDDGLLLWCLKHGVEIDKEDQECVEYKIPPSS